jgi:hypothetical protein
MKKLNFKKLFLSIALLSSLSAFSQNIVSTQNTSGDGFCDGMAILNYTPNPGSWYWQGNNGQILQQGGDTLANLCFGDYILVMTDSSSTNTYTFFIDSTNNSNPCQNYYFSQATTVDVTAPNACDGSATIHMNGNTFQTYNTSQLGVTVTQANGIVTIEGICDGQMHITFINNSCSTSLVCDVSYNDTTNAGCNSLVTTVQTVNASSDNLCDGTIYLASSGGTAPYTYQYTLNGMSLTDTSSYITNVCTGSYTIVTMDANGCPFTSIATVSSDSTNAPCSNLVVTAMTQQNVSGPNMCDGIVWAAASGGTAPYQYSFSNSNLTDSLFTQACEGSVVVTVVDANGCSSSTQVYVGSDSTNTGCSGFYAELTNLLQPSNMSLCNGTGTLVAFGGTAPYTYINTNGNISNGGIFDDLCVGTNVFIAQDANGCSFTISTSLYSADSLNGSGLYGIVSTQNVSETDVCDGVAFVSMQSGTAPFTFTNSTGVTNTTGYFEGLCEGVQTVVVTDANGVTTAITYLISGPTNSSNGGNPNGNTTVIDSLYSGLLENCDIDYSTVDTVLMDSYTVYGQDSVLVVWAVYQANDTLYITENYNMTNGAGVYQVVLTVYCPGRIEGNYWYASAYVNTSSLSIDNMETSNDIEISQIIGQDAILVNLSESASFEWEIVDMTGRVIQHGREDAAKMHVIMMTSISSGHYVFKFMQAETRVTKTIIR